MVDAGTLGGALASLQAAANIAKSMIGLRDTALIQGKVIELQSAILAAQSDALSAQASQSVLLQCIRELEEEVARVKAWDREKEKYELQEIYSGFFAYAIKADAKGAEPAHRICASCYQKDKKSILQKHGENTLRCPDCNSIVEFKRSSFSGPLAIGTGREFP